MGFQHRRRSLAFVAAISFIMTSSLASALTAHSAPPRQIRSARYFPAQSQ